MTCRDCKRPMRQLAADDWICDPCGLEAREELMGVLWTRHAPPIDPKLLDGREIEMGRHTYKLKLVH